jgi:two-component system heavy metal sensor histidine kinase CusS
VSYRFRIAGWVVFSCVVMIAVMIFAGHRQLEEELREGRVDSTHPGKAGWTLHNSYPEEEIRDILEEMLEAWGLVALPMIALSLGGGLLLARRSLKPIHDINRQIAEMKPDSLHGGITIPEADPAISNLAEHLNGLLDKAGTAYREMSEFSSRVAHEIRTPLMLLRLRIENAPPGMQPAFQEEMQDEIARLSRFVERSLVAAKAEQGVLKPASEDIDLADLVRSLAQDYTLLASDRSIQVTLDVANDVRITADPDLLRQALHSLLENAIRYADSRIRISCKHMDGAPELLIRNDYNPQTMATPGLGLGLRLVSGICKASGFQLDENRTSGEFVVRVRFSNLST